MRKQKSILNLIVSASSALLILTSSAALADLIEPTRALNAGGKQHGKLSVFSEPPELPVSLDDAKMGITPLVDLQVETGSHVITVNKVKTEIYVTADKSFRISFFKGAFIDIQDRHAASPVQETRQPTVKTQSAAQQPQDEKNKIEYQPLYWPLNPRGPIY